jgi:superfamily II DNA or RNA helicase
MTFAVGSLVSARGREWVVLPESDPELLILRPLGGAEDETAGILTALEEVLPATFDLPDPNHPGDHRSAELLRNALRLGFRSSAGPFRSFGHLNVEPRPYQLVPLLLALKLDPIRLLIADDVGIGKTIEASLIARELLDSAVASRLAVLCPPHLAEQWQDELASKFNLDAELVLSSTTARLERGLPANQSLFDRYPHVIVSLDFIKSPRYREEFINRCPELVIVDEAHTCVNDGSSSGARQQRYELVRRLAADAKRNMILVTATPHSGKIDAFRALLGLLDPDFADLPDELGGAQNEQLRRRIARHFVQRRRPDIRRYLDADTPFPDREEREETYRLTPEYRRLMEKALAYARETVADESGSRPQQRVRWWSVLALLRSIASSPAAAAETLRNRASSATATTSEEADELGRRSVLDLIGDEVEEGMDVSPGGDCEEEADDTGRVRRRLQEMAREADALQGSKDAKLTTAVTLIKKLVSDGFNPIVFCRFIATADYVADELRKHLAKAVDVRSVTGALAPAEREARVAELGESERHVLVATDCLSEGINLQDHFDAVVHYDLSWNPTRHEQREGRVDRFGQVNKTVRVLTYYGVDNQIDGIVLNVLLRKHNAIRKQLGISIPVPGDPNTVVEAILDSLVLRRRPEDHLEQLILLEADLAPAERELLAEWDRAAEREKASRSMFAQHAVRVEQVALEVEGARRAIGDQTDVQSFVRGAIESHQGTVAPTPSGGLRLDVRDAPVPIRDLVGQDTIDVAFDAAKVPEGHQLLQRASPLVEGLANFVLGDALNPHSPRGARRCAVVRTAAVTRRTTLFLIRYRFHLTVSRGESERQLLAEDVGLVAYAGDPAHPEWLLAEELEVLLRATPGANVVPEQAASFLGDIISGFGDLRGHLEDSAQIRATALLDAHNRVRKEADVRGVKTEVRPQLPVDVLGMYIYLPMPGAGA